MSIQDVPGANLVNKDVLTVGCWAEHQDGSLIFIKGTENNQIVYELHDTQTKQYYPDAMRAFDFKTAFSFPPTGKSAFKWTWHDKTPFPWARVMQSVGRPVPRHADVRDMLSAAAQVAESLKLRAVKLEDEGQGEQLRSKGRNILERFEKAMDAFME